MARRPGVAGPQPKRFERRQNRFDDAFVEQAAGVGTAAQTKRGARGRRRRVERQVSELVQLEVT